MRSEALETFLTLRATWSQAINPGDKNASAWRELYRRAINALHIPWEMGARLYAVQFDKATEPWTMMGHKQAAQALALAIERGTASRWTIIAPGARHAWQGDVVSLYDARVLLGVAKTEPVIEHGRQESFL